MHIDIFCLHVQRVYRPTFVLGPKADHAAEAYILGLFQLYPAVYFHKATRSAEVLFTELLVRIVELARSEKIDATGLPKNHPLIRFALEPKDIGIALTLDDTVIFGALSQMIDASDTLVADFAKRLRDRKLFKCLDIRNDVAHRLDPKCENTDDLIRKIDTSCASINEKLSEWKTKNESNQPRILLDEGERSPYNRKEESKGPLDRINIRTGGGELVDLRERSSVVNALKPFKFFRVYIEKSDTESREAVKNFIKQEVCNEPG